MWITKGLFILVSFIGVYWKIYFWMSTVTFVFIHIHSRNPAFQIHLLRSAFMFCLDDESHPLHDHLSGQLIARSGPMRLPSAVTGRYLSSFVPQAIQHHNANYRRGDVSANCSWLLYSLFLSTHVCNFHFGCNKVLLDLTWLDIYHKLITKIP